MVPFFFAGPVRWASVQVSAVIRPAEPRDTSGIAAIYNHYVVHTTVTFDEQEVSSDDMLARITAVANAKLPWLVAEADNRVIGYAFAAPWRTRSAYRFSAEISVYLDSRCVGRGIGSKLYEQLISMLRERRIHAVLGGIALPNDASIRLHEKFGLRKAAHLSEVGFKFDRWIDVGYWHRNL